MRTVMYFDHKEAIYKVQPLCRVEKLLATVAESMLFVFSAEWRWNLRGPYVIYNPILRVILIFW